jgi:hypothetical protein
MKLKTLKKKIRKLEARLLEGPNKLAKLKRRLEALVIANAAKARRKSAARAEAARQAAKVSPSTPKKKRRSTVESQVRPAAAQRPSAAKKVKRKLNLSPERRAALAAAMKARWAAKRAAAEANPPNAAIDRDFTLQEVPQSP